MYLSALSQDSAAIAVVEPGWRWEPWLALGAGSVLTILAARARRRRTAIALGAGTAVVTTWLWRREIPALGPAPAAAAVPGALTLAPVTMPGLFPFLPSAVAPSILAPTGAPAIAAPVPVLAPTLAPAAAAVEMTEGSAAVVATTARPPAPMIAPQPVQTFHLSDQMLAKLSQKAIEQVLKFFNTPMEVPMGFSPEVTTAWNSYRAGEWQDYSNWTSEQTPATNTADYDVVANSGALDTASGAEAAAAGTETTNVSGAVMGNIGVALKVLGVIGVLVDIGFIIAGNQPDALKAINVALDVAILVCMFIPGIGTIIAVVLTVVKLLLSMFGSELFGGGETHKMREAKEASRAMMQAAQMAGELGATLSPRELVRVLWRWASGYCGGTSPVAIVTILYNRPEGQYLTIGRNPCSPPQHGPYRDWPDVGAMSLDDQAMALLKYAVLDFELLIQAGVDPSYLSGANWSLDEGITAKCAAWYELMVEHGLTLDHFDALAAEQRKQPRLAQISSFYGFDDWHALMGWHLQDLWTRYLVTNRQGTLLEFSQRLGYADWITLRDQVADQYGLEMDKVLDLRDRLMQWATPPPGSGGPPLSDPLAEPFTALVGSDVSPQGAMAARLRQLETVIAAAEGRCAAWNQRQIDLVYQQATAVAL